MLTLVSGWFGIPLKGKDDQSADTFSVEQHVSRGAGISGARAVVNLAGAGRHHLSTRDQSVGSPRSSLELSAARIEEQVSLY